MSTPLPLPPRTQELFLRLSEAHYGESKSERASRVEYPLLELCAQLERELAAALGKVL